MVHIVDLARLIAGYLYLSFCDLSLSLSVISTGLAQPDNKQDKTFATFVQKHRLFDLVMINFENASSHTNICCAKG